MKLSLQINVSKKKTNGGVVTYRHKTIRDRLLRFLLGNPIKLTVIVPGDTVEELAIKEIGGTKDGQENT